MIFLALKKKHLQVFEVTKKDRNKKNGDNFVDISKNGVSHATPIRFFLVGEFRQ